MPESAKQAVQNALKDTGRYPDANGFELKKVISEWICCSAGLDYIGKREQRYH